MCVPRWVRTGDEAIIDANNDVFIVDRLKEIMKVRGFQVAPAELEGHLLNNSFVSDVCVVGTPDEYNGEVPFAFVVPSAEASKRIKRGEEKLVKAQIAKVRICAVSGGVVLMKTVIFSMLRTRRRRTSTWLVGLRSSTLFRRIRVENC